jgi:hypothetical protein
VRRPGLTFVALLAAVAAVSCDPRKFDDLADKTWYRHIDHPSELTGDFGVRVGALATSNGAVVVALAPQRGAAVYTYDSSGAVTDEVALEPPPPLLATDTIRDLADMGGGRLALGTLDNIIIYSDGAHLTGGSLVFQAPPAGIVGVGGRIAAGDVDGDGSVDLVTVADDGQITFIPNGDGSLARTCSLSDGLGGAGTFRSIRVGDWNGDGSVEVIAGVFSNGAPVIDGILVANAAFFVAGTCVVNLSVPAVEAGVLFKRTLASATDAASIVELANYDGTGMKDFVVSDLLHVSVKVYVDATSAPVQLMPAAGDPLAGFGTAIAAGDFDGDGRDEVLVGSPNAAADGTPDAGKVYVYKNGSPVPTAELFDAIPEDNQLIGRALGVTTLGGEPLLLIGGNLEVLVYFKILPAGDDPRFPDQ